MTKNSIFRVLTSVLVAGSMASAPLVVAQEEDEEEAVVAQADEVLIVTGTRRDDRTNVSALSPIDVISADELLTHLGGEMDDLLRATVPSYQVNWHPIDDAATLTRPATLRGLAPDQTLVLVNNVRRHRSGVITFISDALTPGSQGVDLSPIPTMALKQVEVLRDGAAAQYGSDAIAGVINFRLKDANNGGAFEVRTSQTLEGDGQQTRISGNIGLPLTDAGFLNLTGEYSTQDETRRNVERNDVSALIAKRNVVNASTEGLGPDTQIWGQPIIEPAISLFANSGIEISDTMSVYAFGNYAEREVDGGFYFRNPDTRNGVFASGGRRLVGAVTQEALDTNACEQYRLAPAPGPADPDNPTDAEIAAIQADFANLAAIAADPACFSHNAAFPNGFTPRFGGTITDHSIAVGVKGEFSPSLTYDVSLYQGANTNEFKIMSVNSARGPGQPPNGEFRPGDYIQSETSLNADFVAESNPTFIDAPLFIAFGAEWRRETFEINAGDPFSWSHPEDSRRTEYEQLLLQQGFTPASNGFSGFSPTSEGIWDRDNTSLYIDFESDFAPDWSGGLAVRYENYEDFGTNTQFKVSLGKAITEAVSWRMTVSTGFRAPTPGQSNVRNVSTEYDTEVRDLIETGLIPPTNPISVLRGGEALQPEQSVNFSTGLSFGGGGSRVSSVDYFYIQLSDRITTSGRFSLTQEEVDTLLNQGLAGVTTGGVLRYYTNAWATSTTGIEYVNSGPIDIPFLQEGATDLTIAASYVSTRVADIERAVIDARREFNIENIQPKTRATATVTHNQGPWRFLVRGSYWGAWSALDSGQRFADDYAARFLTDVEVGYTLQQASNVELVVGAANIFDTFPTEHPRGVTDSGQLYHEHDPIGGNGTVLYGRVVYRLN